MATNQAVMRLLEDENPYRLAQIAQDAEVMQNDTLKRQTEKNLQALTEQRDKDLTMIEAEKVRLLREERILHTQIPAAERKEEEERRLRMAHHWVDLAVLRGASLSGAIREAGTQFNVNKNDLAKGVMEARGAGLPEAQIRLGALVGRGEGSPEELRKLTNQVQKEFPGLKAEDIMAGVTRAREGRGTGLDAKDLQQLWKNSLDEAIKLSGQSGIQITPGEGGIPTISIGQVK